MVVKVREMREKRGMSMYELAKRTGLSKAFIWDLDRGNIKSPGIGSLTKIAKALGCEVTDLYEDDEEVKPHGDRADRRI